MSGHYILVLISELSARFYLKYIGVHRSRVGKIPAWEAETFLNML